MVQHVISNIEPFNHFRYKTCFFNSFFPVVLSKNKSIIPYLCNDLIYYTPQQDSGQILIDYYPFQEIETVFQNEGFQAELKTKCANVCSDILNAIRNNNPVIIWIDCFYEGIRRDTFQKIHWSHTLLVYGFDLSLRQFLVMEQSNRESLNYSPKWISFEDLENSYYGYFEHSCVTEDTITYFEFSCSDHSQSASAWKETFLINIENHNEKYIQGVKELIAYSEWMKSQIQNPVTLQQSIHSIFEGVCQVVTSKQIELYRFESFDSHERRLFLIQGILKKWMDIRNILGKYYFSSKYVPDSLLHIHGGLDEIINHEWNLVEINETVTVDEDGCL